METRIMRVPTSVKRWFSQPLSREILVFGAPDVQIRTNKSLKKVTWKQTGKRQLCWAKVPEKLSKWIPKSAQNQYKSKSGPQGVLWCAPRCPWIVPWSPRVPKCKHQACQITGVGTKSGCIRVQKDNYKYTKSHTPPEFLLQK